MARSDAEIEQLIDERARAIIAEEKAEAARAEAKAKFAAERAESEARLRARHDELKASAEKLRFDLARNRRWQVEPWPMSRARAILHFILSCLFGLVVHYVAFPILHWTPAILACLRTGPHRTVSSARAPSRARSRSQHFPHTGRRRSAADAQHV